ncbi:hypothetical protein Tco_0328393 [Tanacetum coccineum]
MPSEDDVLPAEEQPLPAAVSPIADSPGYVPKSDPGEDPEEDDDEDTEEDPADYPTDRDDEEEEEPSREEANNEEEDEDDEEEEHPALVDSVPPPVHRVTARISIRPQTPVSLPSDTKDTDEIYVRLGEAQDERSLMSGWLNLYREIDVLMLTLLYSWRERPNFLVRPEDALRAVDRARQAQLMETLRLMSTLQKQVTALQGQLGPARGPAQPEIPEEAYSSS